MDEYVARKRARLSGVGGPVNIPFGSALRAEGDFLFWRGKAICSITSQNAYDYFSRNDDGHGLERGALVTSILKRLLREEYDTDAYQARWNKVWADPLCQKYRRPEHADFWIWSYDFYNAPIEDLRYIASLVGAKNNT